MSMNHTIRSRVRNTSQHIPFFHLVIVKKRTIGLVNRTTNNLSSTCGTRTRPARVRELNPCTLSRVKNVAIIRRLKLVLFTSWSDELNLVCSHGCCFEKLA
ncbi:hypothetical protein HanRHA438_Chr13g0591981 [Helianthus annuus]|uniref:Uncharacterized protein n=1 Tax=Helianthus annuus TaxID=4232 RepID=A0A9K3H9L6_HELAN|nr:hypothetical protein HanXRQr2_Chr13g0581251 [Helianthus annuus]KAJ0857596.1 hypothetical protein HanRHA438_Chr13g0591981 [Helianthus annuus]